MTPVDPTDGFTLIEVLAVVALIAALTALTATTLPQFRSNPVNRQLSERLASQLEAAHTQAYAERQPLTLTGQRDLLFIDGPDGREQVPLQNATLTGQIVIDSYGRSTGALQLYGAGIPCTAFSISNAGLSVQGAC